MYLLNILCKLASVSLYPKNTVTNSLTDDFFCYSYVKYYAILVILSLLLSEPIWAWTLKHFFHHVLAILSSYLVKLDTFEMTDIP